MSHNIFGFSALLSSSPILENFLFRGAIEGHLLRKDGHLMGHTGFRTHIRDHTRQSCTNTFCIFIGLLFGWLYYRTGSLVPGIVGHIINNSFGRMDHVHSPPERKLSQTTMETLGTTITYILLVLTIIRFYRYVSLLNKYLPKPTNIQVKAINDKI
ncbi:CPBP family intramembrane metalloprotease [Phocaeicola dorei]|nr:CPBP family intramembrane metalloprotease [Phocaeicola dorei]